MKKYLLAFIPFAGCTLISLAFALMEPRGPAHSSYPYRTEQYLHYFTNRWFYIGIVISLMLAFCMLVDDIFNKAHKYMEDRRYKKYMKERNGT